MKVKVCLWNWFWISVFQIVRALACLIDSRGGPCIFWFILIQLQGVTDSYKFSWQWQLRAKYDAQKRPVSKDFSFATILQSRITLTGDHCNGNRLIKDPVIGWPCKNFDTCTHDAIIWSIIKRTFLSPLFRLTPIFNRVTVSGYPLWQWLRSMLMWYAVESGFVEGPCVSRLCVGVWH